MIFRTPTESEEHEFRQRYTFLTLMRAGDYESCLRMNPVWTRWVLDNQHPYTIPVSNQEQIPFFSPYFQMKFIDLWNKILKKQQIFAVDYSPDPKYDFHEKGQVVYPQFFIKLPKDYITVVASKKYGKVWANVGLRPRERKALKFLMPKVYLIGVSNSKEVLWYHYITHQEFSDRRVQDKSWERLMLTNNLITSLGDMKSLSGVRAESKEDLKKGSYLMGQEFFKMKVVDV